MEFVSFEDATGLYDATVFPAVYWRVCHLLAADQAYLIEGIVEEESGAVTLTVSTLQSLHDQRQLVDARGDHSKVEISSI